MDKYLKQLLALTVESEGFSDMSMSEKEFALVLKSCEKILADLCDEGGDELLDELLDALEAKEEWKPVFQLLESLLYDD